MFKKVKKLAVLAVVLVLALVAPTLVAFAEEPVAPEVEDYHLEWPEGCYYRPYGSIAELPPTIQRYNNVTSEEMFNSATYFYVADTDLAYSPGSVIASGSTEDGAVWDISIPELHNAVLLKSYCEQYGIVLIMAHHTTDRNRVVLIGLDKGKLDTSRVMIGAQATFGSDSVFEIQMSGQIIDIPHFRNTDGLVNRAIVQWASAETTPAIVWSVDNLGKKKPMEDGYVFESKIASNMSSVPYFSKASVTLTDEIEDYAIKCIENYLATSTEELG